MSRDGLVVVVADIRELSAGVLTFLDLNGIEVCEVGVACCNSGVVDYVFINFSEVWNIGSVGSTLPVGSSFWVGCGFGVTPSVQSIYSVKTVSEFLTSIPEGVTSVDMELGILASKASDYGVTLHSLKYVSDNFDLSSDSDWYSVVESVALKAESGVLQLLKSRLWM